MVASIDGAWGAEEWRLSSPVSCRHVRRRLGAAACRSQHRWYLSAYEPCTVACFRIDWDERKGEQDEKDEKNEKDEKGVGIMGAKDDDATFLSRDGVDIRIIVPVLVPLWSTCSCPVLVESHSPLRSWRRQHAGWRHCSSIAR